MGWLSGVVDFLLDLQVDLNRFFWHLPKGDAVARRRRIQIGCILLLGIIVAAAAIEFVVTIEHR